MVGVVFGKEEGFIVGALTAFVSGLFMGMGYYTRANAEYCLLATKGKVLERKSKAVPSAVVTPIERHSKKPDVVRERIVALFGDRPRIELFARQHAEGWDCWGNEV
jgi:N6-adenosine-specific RNA methylase IME4